jgi:3-hydroxymyristoyl/3-hydroxydecanoyl-(acyl carrier protein) dehydratase
MWHPIAPGMAAVLMMTALFAGQASAQVVGLSLGAPFRDGSTAGVATTAPAYAPYLGPVPHKKQPANLAALLESLRARGFSHFSDVHQKGGNVICEATGPRRERVRLVVDAATGEISGVVVIGFGDKRY